MVRTLCQKSVPNTKTILSFSPLDLNSLESIAEFTKQFNEREIPLDILVNNAGIMACSSRQVTKDGFEATLGINHLAHFAFTGQLLPSLLRSTSPRIVNVSSASASFGKMDFNDLNYERKNYSPMKVYSQSKLANLLFTLELQKQSDEKGWGLTVISNHPGLVKTNFTNGITRPGNDSLATKLTTMFLHPFFALKGAKGAASSLFAATSSSAKSGEYYGPSGLLMNGHVTKLNLPNLAKDPEVAKQLWHVSEQLTHVLWK